MWLLFGKKEQVFIELQDRMIETTSKFKQVTWIWLDLL